ncbi:MAG: peptide-methionine (S)-S-oxide reductase MsrA [Gemmatimonadaceae bacterium]
MTSLRLVPFVVVLGAGAVLALSRPEPVAPTPSEAPPYAGPVDTATFAGGCFWSMERPFDGTKGVVSTIVGYTGGTKANPTYDDVGTRTTGHAESVEVHYDPTKVTYEKLLYIYWHNIDPVTAEAQFCDHGNDYRTAIFYHNEAQHKAAEASRQELDKSGLFKSPIVTQIAPASTFWKAEEYHQHYADKNPMAYRLYRVGCGRDARLTQLWGSSAEPNVPPL